MKKILLMVVLFNFLSCSLLYFPLYQTMDIQSDQTDIKVQVLGDGKVIEEFTYPKVKEIKIRKAYHTVLRFSKPGYYSSSIMLSYVNSKMATVSFIVNALTLWVGLFFVDEPLGAVYSMYPENIQIKLLPVNENSVKREINLNLELNESKVSLSNAK